MSSHILKDIEIYSRLYTKKIQIERYHSLEFQDIERLLSVYRLRVIHKLNTIQSIMIHNIKHIDNERFFNSSCISDGDSISIDFKRVKDDFILWIELIQEINLVFNTTYNILELIQFT